MSGVQFNLLPDVKLAYVKAQRSRRLVTVVAVLLSSVAIAILLIMVFTVEVVQRKQLNDAAAAVTTANKQLSGIAGLDQVMTVQNQLYALATLHQQKHISSRLMLPYLPNITPSNVQISQVSLDLTKNTLSISGTAASQLAVNTFVDTLEFAQFKVGSQSARAAFTSVVESTFSLTNNGTTYTITANVDPGLFANTGQTPQIILNNQITTRSVLEDPSNFLFTGTNSKQGSQ
ncbi:MAG TPA: PilN domain-containing protein [Candidatus Nitrosopolaris sp.]|nr:PilN domain-containing protein [Candidatus Nitrosopolaris sp.]